MRFKHKIFQIMVTDRSFDVIFVVHRGQNVDGHGPVHAASIIIVWVSLQTSDVQTHVGAGQVGLAPVRGRVGGQVCPTPASA